MENLIPRWYRELELFRGVKPLLVLEGCVMDQVRDAKVSENDWVRSLALRQALEHLDARERGIIERRFFEGRTQMEVAGEIGISQAQVSRLEKGAIGAMRKSVSVS